jgi:hypothetical protein
MIDQVSADGEPLEPNSVANATADRMNDEIVVPLTALIETIAEV